MATNHTTNYQLCQWEATDKVLRTDFNQDNQKIDAALKANADAIALKADSSALSALAASTQSALAGKADLSAVPKIAVGTYTGNGGCGSAQKNTLTFPFSPRAVVVAGGSYQGVTLMLRPHAYAAGIDTAGRGSVLRLAWGDSSLSWYVDGYANGGSVSSTKSAKGQLNEDGVTYTYLALCEGA